MRNRSSYTLDTQSNEFRARRGVLLNVSNENDETRRRAASTFELFLQIEQGSANHINLKCERTYLSMSAGPINNERQLDIT